MKIILKVCLLLMISINTFADKYDLIICKGHYFLPVTINNKPALLIIDTGSTKSIIDVSKDSIFNFKYIEFGNQQYLGIGGNCQIYMVYDYSIKEINIVPFLGVNINNITTLFNTDIPVLGILGNDFLFASKAILNYKTNTIEF